MLSWMNPSVADSSGSLSTDETLPLSGHNSDVDTSSRQCSIRPETMKNLRLGCFVVLGLSCIFLWMFVNVGERTKDFLSWTKEHRLLGVLLLALSIVAAAIMMLPVTPLLLGAGYSLGVMYGQIAVSLGCTSGAQLAFFVARRLLRDWVEEMVIPRFPMLSSLDGVMNQKQHALRVCLLIRMCPILPFSMLNFSLGSTCMGWKNHLLGTWIGMFPEQLMIVYLGSQLRDLNAVMGGEAQMMKHGGGSSVGAWIVLIVLIIFTIIGTMYSQRELREIALQHELDKANDFSVRVENETTNLKTGDSDVVQDKSIAPKDVF